MEALPTIVIQSNTVTPSIKNSQAWDSLNQI